MPGGHPRRHRGGGGEVTLRCRHSDSWLLGHVHFIEWCYRCGAFRRLRDDGCDGMKAVSPWCKPIGPSGENPWDAWQRRTTRYLVKLEAEGKDGKVI